jgi:hypothetical protein
MAERESAAANTPEPGSAGGAARSANEVALEMMKFIAVTTGYGKTPRSGTGFSGKMEGRSTEEHVEALLELFDRCRRAIKKED